jgi:hypothetical protein
MKSTKLGWIYLMPSKASKVIVKYSPRWMISCVLPKTERKISVKSYNRNTDVVDAKEFDIETPELIISHSLTKPWIDKSKMQTYFSLFTIDSERSDGVFTTPYRLANTYPSGVICFGGVVSVNGMIKAPANLRQANNYYWASYFNEDNCPYVKLHRESCNNFNHEYYEHYEIEDCCECHSYMDDPDDFDSTTDCSCEPCECECCRQICGCGCGCDLQDEFHSWITNYAGRVKTKEFIKKTAYFCGKKYFAYPEPAQAVFVSNNPELLETIPKTSWRRDCQDTNVVIGVATKQDTAWDINLGSFHFSIENNKVITV